MESAGGLPKLIQVAIGAAKIRPSLRVIALDVRFELDTLRGQLRSCLPHVFHLERKNRATVKPIVSVLGAKDLEQLSRGQLKLDQTLTLIADGQTQVLGKETCRRFQGGSPHPYPRKAKHPH